MAPPTRAIFISHAYADRAVARLLATALNVAGVPDSEIFFSSSRATGVPAGKDVLGDLRTGLKEARLVIELVSTTFLSRPMCTMEFGAAWAMDKDTFPIVVPPLTRAEATPEVGNVFMHHLVDEEAVDELLDDLHAAVVKAIGRNVTIASWKKAANHLKAGLSAALAPPVPPVPSVPSVPSVRSVPAAALPRKPARAASTGRSAGTSPAPTAEPATGSDLEEATDLLRSRLRAVKRATRWVVLHHTIWRDAYIAYMGTDTEDIQDAENDREIEYSETYEGWVPRDQHRKVEAAIRAAKAWLEALDQCDPDEAEKFMDEYDLNELDAKSHDNWRKLDLI